jgi:carbonic anhydrase/acetyltransferase-like protein (isoleucine patch superfamily)
MPGYANDRCWLERRGGAFVASTASVMGEVTLGPDASVWYGAVVRGDDGAIAIGARSNLQDNAVCHALPPHPTSIGADVTVGHGAILHMRSIGDRCLIGMGAILLGHAEIGEESIVAAGALVKEGAVIPPRSLVVGMPGRVLRKVTDEEVRAILESAKEYAKKAAEHVRTENRETRRTP